MSKLANQKLGLKVEEDDMEEEQNYVPKIIYSEIDGDKTKEIYKTVTRGAS